jgi:hypothetical protein
MHRARTCSISKSSARVLNGKIDTYTPLQWGRTGGETGDRHDTLVFQVDLLTSCGDTPADLI